MRLRRPIRWKRACRLYLEFLVVMHMHNVHCTCICTCCIVSLLAVSIDATRRGCKVGSPLGAKCVRTTRGNLIMKGITSCGWRIIGIYDNVNDDDDDDDDEDGDDDDDDVIRMLFKVLHIQYSCSF